MPLLAMPEGGEWIVLLIIVVLLFGAGKLPELTRNTAHALVEFRKATGSEPDDSPSPPAADEPAVTRAAVEDDSTKGAP